MRNGVELNRVQRELRPLVAETLACLAGSHHRWARPLDWVLRTRWIRLARLPGRWQGFTFAVLPIIWLDRDFALNGMRQPEQRSRVVHTLLHEASHQLGAVWPEWRGWIGSRNNYGPDRNAADAISEAIVRECYVNTRYGGQEISYVSPLRRIGLLKH